MSVLLMDCTRGCDSFLWHSTLSDFQTKAHIGGKLLPVLTEVFGVCSPVMEKTSKIPFAENF